jgi:predicted membrane-bound spermidine synthase
MVIMKATKILDKLVKGYTILEEVESKINGQIKVDEDIFGKRRLLVGGLTQSGPAVEKIWESVISNLLNLQIANCLILGLGAGNAAKIINKYFPKGKITGIEIDPEIVNLGNKYFGLSEIINLDIIISDAISLTNNHSLLTNNYDLVLVDLYLGDCFPEKAESTQFLKSLSHKLNIKGTVVFNRLYFGNHKEETDKFEQIIRKVFSPVEAKITDYNKIFLCRK